MDPKLVASTFLAIFLAEIGDKTQLATLSFAASGRSRWAVFLGASLALVCATALAVVAGEALTKLVPPVWLHRGAGILFVVLGAVMLVHYD